MLAGAVLPGWSTEVKPLLVPEMTGGMPLMQGISQRHSSSDFDSAKAVGEQKLSEILWVTWGMNAHGKHTIPTSRPGEFTVTVTPKSTAKRTLNRLMIDTDSTDPRFARCIIYLQVKK